MNQEEVQEMIEYSIEDADNEDLVEQLDPDVQDNEEGVTVVAEDNIVSKEKSFVKNKEEEDMNNSLDTQKEPDTEEVVASIDDHESEQSTAQSRPKRINTGAGVERIKWISQERDVELEDSSIL